MNGLVSVRALLVLFTLSATCLCQLNEIAQTNGRVYFLAVSNNYVLSLAHTGRYDYYGQGATQRWTRKLTQVNAIDNFWAISVVNGRQDEFVVMTDQTVNNVNLDGARSLKRSWTDSNTKLALYVCENNGGAMPKCVIIFADKRISEDESSSLKELAILEVVPLDASLTSDGFLMYIDGSDRVYVRNIYDGKPYTSLKVKDKQLTSVYGSNASFVYLGTSDGEVLKYSTGTGKLLQTYLTGDALSVNYVAVANGSVLAASRGGKIYQWDERNPNASTRFDAQSPLLAFAVAPSGNMVYASYVDNNIRSWTFGPLIAPPSDKSDNAPPSSSSNEKGSVNMGAVIAGSVAGTVAMIMGIGLGVWYSRTHMSKPLGQSTEMLQTGK